MIDGVLLDLDGVLVNSIPAHGKAWAWIMESVGIKVDPFVAPLTEGMRSREIARLIFKAAENDQGLRMNDAELDEMIERKRTYYRSIVGKVQISDEMLEMLATLKKRVSGIALVTSTAKINLDHVISPEQQTVFDSVIWADSVTHVKPHPEPFLKAAESLGLTPGKCLVVENAPLGIRSARAAGMWCAAISSTMPEDKLGEAHIVLESAMELVEESTWERLRGIIEREKEPVKLEPDETLVAPIPIIEEH